MLSEMQKDENKDISIFSMFFSSNILKTHNKKGKCFSDSKKQLFSGNLLSDTWTDSIRTHVLFSKVYQSLSCPKRFQTVSDKFSKCACLSGGYYLEYPRTDTRTANG